MDANKLFKRDVTTNWAKPNINCCCLWHVSVQTSSHILHLIPSMHTLCGGVGLHTVVQWSSRLDYYQDSFLMYQNCMYIDKGRYASTWQSSSTRHCLHKFLDTTKRYSYRFLNDLVMSGQNFHVSSRDWLEPFRRWHRNVNVLQMHTCSLSGMEFRSNVVLTCILGKWRGWSSFGSTCCNSSGKPGAFCSSPCCESKLFSFSLNAKEDDTSKLYGGRCWAKSVEIQVQPVPCWYLLVFLFS